MKFRWKGGLFMLAVIAMMFICTDTQQAVAGDNGGGFDQFGYNYTARIFNGDLDGADRNLDGKYWGDPTYANDKLKMSWSKGWDDARFNGAPWGPDAWTDNHYNGRGKNGSGEIWHYKIIWVGTALQNSQYWHEGGYAIWGQFEVIFDQGSTADHEHVIGVIAHSAGYGGPN